VSGSISDSTGLPGGAVVSVPSPVVPLDEVLLGLNYCYYRASTGTKSEPGRSLGGSGPNISPIVLVLEPWEVNRHCRPRA
jgi:hypothetical protein